MDKITLIDWIHTAMVAVAGWVAKIIYTQQRDLYNFKEEVSKTYVTKEEQEKTNDKIFEKLDKIIDKLDTKADKK